MIIRWKRVTGLSIYALTACLLAFLGSWQFQRGRDKAEIESAIDTGAAATAIAAAPVEWHPLAYQRVVLRGRWLSERNFLLQNRVHNGQVGFEVLTPFTLTGGATLLVNRGWLGANGSDRSRIGASELADPEGTLYLPEAGFRLGETITGDPVWPQPALYLDPEALGNRLGETLEPAVLVLDAGHPASFARLWQPTNMPASRHYGYAVQWWGLLLALLVLGFFWKRNLSAGNKR